MKARACDKTALSLACRDDDIPHKIFSMIVASGADLTMTYFCGMNALHLCVNHQALLEKIECLLKNGININAKNWFGETPLHNAAKERNTKVASLLLQYIVNILARTYENNTALMEVLRQDDAICEDETMSVCEEILAKINPPVNFFSTFKTMKAGQLCTLQPITVIRK